MTTALSSFTGLKIVASALVTERVHVRLAFGWTRNGRRAFRTVSRTRPGRHAIVVGDTTFIHPVTLAQLFGATNHKPEGE